MRDVDGCFPCEPGQHASEKLQNNNTFFPPWFGVDLSTVLGFTKLLYINTYCICIYNLCTTIIHDTCMSHVCIPVHDKTALSMPKYALNWTPNV